MMLLSALLALCGEGVLWYIDISVREDNKAEISSGVAWVISARGRTAILPPTKVVMPDASLLVHWRTQDNNISQEQCC